MRGKQPEKDRSERYLLTYADMMNLLLILFIVLYSMSKVDAKKAAEVAEAIRNGVNGRTVTTVANVSSKVSSSKSAAPATDYSDFLDKLVQLIKDKGLGNKVDVLYDNQEVVITLRDTVLFDPGKYDINLQAQSLMTTIGGLLKQISFGQIYVDGHTDSDPIHTAIVQDNLDLSSKRADSVERILLSCGLDPNKIVAAGHGEYQPVAPNDNAADKAKNRRVVLTIMRKGSVPPDKYLNATDLSSAILSESSSQQSSSPNQTSSANTAGSLSKSASSKGGK